MREIILNEKEYAANLLAFGSIGRSPALAAEILARHYMAQGMTAKQTKELIDHHLTANWEGYNRVLWGDTLQEIIQQARCRPLLEVDYIGVTQQELDRIAEADGKKQRRLLFTLLCLAKYGNAKNDKNNDWVSVKRYRHSGIFRMAKVTANEKERCRCIKQLKDASFLEYSRVVDNINVRVTFVDQEGPAVASVRDFENLGYEYRRILGEPYFECAECGHLTRRHSNAQKYCPACAKAAHERAGNPASEGKIF